MSVGESVSVSVCESMNECVYGCLCVGVFVSVNVCM